MKNFYGYMRVSTIEQNMERQKIELLRWGIIEQNIFCDKLSGKDFNRPQYQKLKQKLHEGDVLVVKSIDRLGRNYEDIQEEWREIVKGKKADIVILDMPILDTRTNKDLIGTLISDIVLQLLSYVAQAERENIKQRQLEGIAIAKAQGKHLGRFPSPIPDEFYPVYEKWLSHEHTLKSASSELGVTVSQFRTMIKKHKNQ
ncbi:recombinase family protein [Bariatricus massiliensis]|uniref:Recombinase family protein n=2 Tax=Bariatricus massiliensis TaxID=1745713 RepID=A0ABS8DGS9_9FIRM|nr:recombinase family protein [Bariatricus massiliensis]MCB7304512.1 recombinase family protein [Bariatricus massiliensis]MCB7375164.1 recombinase family protein [Bariatricus massiliensis]MCB7387623.1 recombinase family protein [Bariatricus massiliensis]MCB7411784.1 recombinase family protein [Bariatricus massiliensis]MCQ5253920.1 recombinase family protein [Bariatricus massiliensis]